MIELSVELSDGNKGICIQIDNSMLPQQSVGGIHIKTLSLSTVVIQTGPEKGTIKIVETTSLKKVDFLPEEVL